jgi:Domain of unknown function (DUF1992)
MTAREDQRLNGAPRTTTTSSVPRGGLSEGAEPHSLRRLQLQEDHIGRALRDSERSGELKAAPSWGRPMDFGDGYAETPAEMRMPFKILKDAGVVPHEVLLFREAAALRERIAALGADSGEARPWRQRLVDIEQSLALRLERLRVNGTL